MRRTIASQSHIGEVLNGEPITDASLKISPRWRRRRFMSLQDGSWGLCEECPRTMFVSLLELGLTVETKARPNSRRDTKFFTIFT